MSSIEFERLTFSTGYRSAFQLLVARFPVDNFLIGVESYFFCIFCLHFCNLQLQPFVSCSSRSYNLNPLL